MNQEVRNEFIERGPELIEGENTGQDDALKNRPEHEHAEASEFDAALKEPAEEQAGVLEQGSLSNDDSSSDGEGSAEDSTSPAEAKAVADEKHRRSTAEDEPLGSAHELEENLEAGVNSTAREDEPEAAIPAESETAEEPNGVAAISGGDETEKAKFFTRRKGQGQEAKRLAAELEKLTSEHQALKDRYLRLVAEMDNFRKRTDRDFQNRLQNAFAEMVVELLPILDDLERSLNTKSETRDDDSLLNGVKIICQSFKKVLEDRGVRVMQTVGTEFNPNVHEALTQISSEGKPAGIVLEEHIKGYMLNDRVLRPARVIVSK